MKRIFRFVVSFLLICVILVNCSPIRAKAVEPVTLVLVSAATVIASVMIGIGVMMGQNREAFDQVVQMVQGSNALKDFIQKDETNTEVIPLYRSPGTGGVGSGALSLLVAGALIEAIRHVLFEDGILVEDSPDFSDPSSLPYFLNPISEEVPIGPIYFSYFKDVPGSSSFSWDSSFISGTNLADLIDFDTIKPSSSSEWVSYYNYFSGDSSSADSLYLLIECTNSTKWQDRRIGLYAKKNGSVSTLGSESWYETKKEATGIYYVLYPAPESSEYVPSKVYQYLTYSDGSNGLSSASADLLSFSSADSTVTSGYDFSLGEIAPLDQELSEGYSDWVAGSQWDVNNSQWWPIAVAPTYEETVTFPQEQVQKGEGTLKEEDLDNNTDPEPDSDQVTASGLKGWIDGLKDRMTLLLQPLSLTVSNILDAVSAIPEAIVSPIKDFFTPSGNVDSYAIDLTSFFPFCIPFDLYDFLSLFSAEPEAPHLEFDIDFPYMNEPWHLVIDLSAWDGVAQLLRRLELLLFIVGLGMVTREKFLRG